jgi:hypothetical protein
MSPEGAPPVCVEQWSQPRGVGGRTFDPAASASCQLLTVQCAQVPAEQHHIPAEQL